MKVKDLRALDAAERSAKQADFTREYYVLREGIRAGREKHTARLGQLRRDLARLKTLETEAKKG